MNKDETKELSRIAIWDRYFALDFMKKVKEDEWILQDDINGLFLIKPPSWRVVVHAGMENLYVKNKYNPVYDFYHHDQLMYQVHTCVMRSSTSYSLRDMIIHEGKACG